MLQFDGDAFVEGQSTTAAVSLSALRYAYGFESADIFYCFAIYNHCADRRSNSRKLSVVDHKQDVCSICEKRKIYFLLTLFYSQRRLSQYAQLFNLEH